MIKKFDKFVKKVGGKINKFVSNGTLARCLLLIYSILLTSVILCFNHVFELYSTFILSRHHVVITTNDYEYYRNRHYFNYWIKNEHINKNSFFQRSTAAQLTNPHECIYTFEKRIST